MWVAARFRKRRRVPNPKGGRPAPMRPRERIDSSDPFRPDISHQCDTRAHGTRLEPATAASTAPRVGLGQRPRGDPDDGEGPAGPRGPRSAGPEAIGGSHASRVRLPSSTADPAGATAGGFPLGRHGSTVRTLGRQRTMASVRGHEGPARRSFLGRPARHRLPGLVPARRRRSGRQVPSTHEARPRLESPPAPARKAVTGSPPGGGRFGRERHGGSRFGGVTRGRAGRHGSPSGGPWRSPSAVRRLKSEGDAARGRRRPRGPSARPSNHRSAAGRCEGGGQGGRGLHGLPV